jgi:hypothetical protein
VQDIHHRLNANVRKLICEFQENTASNSSISSYDLALLTMEHQALLIVSASISAGNDQLRQKQLHVVKRIFIRLPYHQSLTLPKENARFSQSSNMSLSMAALALC